MGENSNIEWTDHTFNPWRGCVEVHAGCDHCYAREMSKRNPATLGVWGNEGAGTGIRVVAGESYWRGPLKWNRDAAAEGIRQRVFCASLADVFEDWQGPMHNSCDEELCFCRGCGAFVTYVSGHHCDSPLSGRAPSRLSMDDVRRRLFALIDATPRLDWILVTKRPENVRRMWPQNSPAMTADLWGKRGGVDAGNYRPNVWLLTSVSDQESADKQIPSLLACRDLATVLGISAEPLLGPIDLGSWLKRSQNIHLSLSVSGALRNKSFDGFTDGAGRPLGRAAVETELKSAAAKGIDRLPMGECDAFDPQTGCRGHRNPSLDWVIVGGESGGHARPMHPAWVRFLRDQCTGSGVSFFFKQWGEFLPEAPADAKWRDVRIDRSGRDVTMSPGLWDEADAVMYRVGKKNAGRVLDGRYWSQFPGAEVAA